jgi:hypothetical protein
MRKTEKKLYEAQNMPKVRFQSVADAVKECCDNIDNYLQEYNLVHPHRLDYLHCTD